MIELRTIERKAAARDIAYTLFAQSPVDSTLPPGTPSRIDGGWDSTALAVLIILLMLMLILLLRLRRIRKSANSPVRSWRHGDVIGSLPFFHSQTPEANGHAQTLGHACEQASSSAGRSCLRIAIVGTYVGAGVTSTAVALARAFARDGHRTLLLDLNFNRPGVQHASGVRCSHGISNYLVSGFIDNIVLPDSRTHLDIIGTGNVPVVHLQTLLDAVDYKDSLLALMALYERVVLDCGTFNHRTVDLSAIEALCDLRLVVIDEGNSPARSAAVSQLLQTHEDLPQGLTVLLHNKVGDSAHTARPVVEQTGARQAAPVQSEAWIVRQNDEHYTLKLTETNYRPLLTRGRQSLYGGHPLACFKLTILGTVQYVLILGLFDSEDQALATALALGLTNSPVKVLRFADIKKGIQREMALSAGKSHPTSVGES